LLLLTQAWHGTFTVWTGAALALTAGRAAAARAVTGTTRARDARFSFIPLRFGVFRGFVTDYSQAVTLRNHLVP
jgi:hypothetical protein